jgi:hypothetical protein
MKNIVIAAVSALLFSCPALAQQTLLGKYSGTYSAITLSGGNPIHVGLTLELASLEDGIVKGKAARMGGPCRGDYPVEGMIKGDELELRATRKGGPAGDCGMRLRLTVVGNKLVGTMNKNKAELSK